MLIQIQRHLPMFHKQCQMTYCRTKKKKKKKESFKVHTLGSLKHCLKYLLPNIQFPAV